MPSYDVPNKGRTVAYALAFGVVAVLVVLLLISRSVRSGEDYLHALSFATRAPAVVADLGEPIDDGMLPTLKDPMSSKPTRNVGITLSGPKGKGYVWLTEVHEKSGWQVVRASWTFEGATKDLAGEPPP